MTEQEIENITQQIDETMKQLFIETLRLYEVERQFNYENYGLYPYRDRKNSVQIIADFNAMAYSINGLFVEESEYIRVYPPLAITRIENVLTQVNIFRVLKGDLEGNVETFESRSEVYELQEVTEYVEIEDTTVQTIRYLFPFTVSQNINDMVLSLVSG